MNRHHDETNDAYAGRNSRYPKLEDIPDTTRLWNVPMGRRFFEEVRTIDPFKAMKKFRKPVLIIQGDADHVTTTYPPSTDQVGVATFRFWHVSTMRFTPDPQFSM